MGKTEASQIVNAPAAGRVAGDAASALHHRSASLPATPPFDFARSLAFGCAFAPMGGEQQIVDGHLRKPLRITGTTLLADISAEPGGVCCTLWSERPIDDALADRAFARVGQYLGLADDLGPLYEIARGDPAFAPVVAALYGYHQLRFPTPFEVACWAILAQRTPMASARTLKRRLITACSAPFVDDTGTGPVPLAPFPEPADLAAASPEALGAVLGNPVKGARIRSATQAFLDVDDEFLRTGAWDDVETWLRRIDGIGPWSASFVLIRGLGRMERVPTGDAALAQAVAARYATEATPQRMQALAARYGVHQGYWAHLLRVAA